MKGSDELVRQMNKDFQEKKGYYSETGWSGDGNRVEELISRQSVRSATVNNFNSMNSVQRSRMDDLSLSFTPMPYDSIRNTSRK